jgi:FlaA1/EpsC-like NDP-sugar epimerase
MRVTQHRPLRKAVKYLGDGAFLIGCYAAAFALRFDGSIPPEHWSTFRYSAPLIVLTKIILLYHYGQYQYFWRHTGIAELLSLGKALSLAALFITVDYALVMGFVTFPRSIILFDWGISLVALACFRILPRFSAEGSRPVTRSLKRGLQRTTPAVRQNVLLYGAGDLGSSLAEQIERKYSRTKRILGFIDDDPALAHMRIHGIEVLGGRAILAQLAKRHRIDEIIVTISAISGKQLRDLVESCQQVSRNVQVAPGLNELFLGKVRVSDLREFQIEDLLGRESERVNLDEERLHAFLQGRVVLVTGAGGSIGSELCFQILKFRPKKLILLGRGENSIYDTKHRLMPRANGIQIEEIIGDIINRAKVDKVFSRHRPEIVFHAAADKHVPLMELNPDEAVLNNIIGTQNVLTAADEHRVRKVVCISSDKAVNPTSVMGCCKRMTELLVVSHAFSRTVCSAVRFGNVMGSRGSVIPLFKRQIAEGGPITITDPQIKRYFMTIPEAVLLVLEAGAASRGGEIFLLEMGEQIRIVDLARQMIHLAGAKEESIRIDYIGLRPGEKLEEELAFPYETVTPTSQRKLYRLDGPRPPAAAELWPKIEHLRQLSIAMDFEGIRQALQELVPEYHPQPARVSTSPAIGRIGGV